VRGVEIIMAIAIVSPESDKDLAGPCLAAINPKSRDLLTGQPFQPEALAEGGEISGIKAGHVGKLH
jgi:hypothetical protein